MPAKKLSFFILFFACVSRLSAQNSDTLFKPANVLSTMERVASTPNTTGRMPRVMPEF
jgi:hypothetical protein